MTARRIAFRPEQDQVRAGMLVFYPQAQDNARKHAFGCARAETNVLTARRPTLGCVRRMSAPFVVGRGCAVRSRNNSIGPPYRSDVGGAVLSRNNSTGLVYGSSTSPRPSGITPALAGPLSTHSFALGSTQSTPFMSLSDVWSTVLDVVGANESTADFAAVTSSRHSSVRQVRPAPSASSIRHGHRRTALFWSRSSRGCHRAEKEKLVCSQIPLLRYPTCRSRPPFTIAPALRHSPNLIVIPLVSDCPDAGSEHRLTQLDSRKLRFGTSLFRPCAIEMRWHNVHVRVSTQATATYERQLSDGPCACSTTAHRHRGA